MFELTPIGFAKTPFKQKFGIPRQAGLVGIPGVIELVSPFDQEAAIKGLEACTHIWLIFVFHKNPRSKSLSVRPPRLGGNEKCGVYATRASFRPNGLGLTSVRLDGLTRDGGIKLQVSGVDLLDGTPILDIKPYLPYADCLPDAKNDIADQKPKGKYRIIWLDTIKDRLIEEAADSAYSSLQIIEWVEALLALDPRPAYKTARDDGVYWFQFDKFDFAWQVVDSAYVKIIDIKRLE